ncbi:MAG: hypothetical protein GY778_04985 [bacterium]|nr:hypothetical protein [bacterium]
MTLLAPAYITVAAAAGPDGSAPPAAPNRPEWQPVGRLTDAAVAECSGIVASRRYPGIFWIHNDSEHPPELFAVRASGEVVARFHVRGAVNSDWEDIAADAEGNLYVGDVGNNFGLFPVRSIYRLAEPDPFADPPQQAAVAERHKFSYPGERFNIEALFVRGKDLFVISRQRLPGQTRIWRVDTASSGAAEAPPLIEVAALDHSRVSGADLSPDGRKLAVCTPGSLSVFALDDRGWFPTDVKPQWVKFPWGKIEACCFDGSDVVLASEDRSIYRVGPADLEAGVRYRRPGAPRQRPDGK